MDPESIDIQVTVRRIRILPFREHQLTKVKVFDATRVKDERQKKTHNRDLLHGV
jgi:hypothetical protein